MGEWVEIRQPEYYPCNNCGVGWTSISQKTENGKLYQKVDSCKETCRKYDSFLKEGYMKLGFHDNNTAASFGRRAEI